MPLLVRGILTLTIIIDFVLSLSVDKRFTGTIPGLSPEQYALYGGSPPNPNAPVSAAAAQHAAEQEAQRAFEKASAPASSNQASANSLAQIAQGVAQVISQANKVVKKEKLPGPLIIHSWGCIKPTPITDTRLRTASLSINKEFSEQMSKVTNDLGHGQDEIFWAMKRIKAQLEDFERELIDTRDWYKMSREERKKYLTSRAALRDILAVVRGSEFRNSPKDKQRKILHDLKAKHGDLLYMVISRNEFVKYR